MAMSGFWLIDRVKDFEEDNEDEYLAKKRTHGPAMAGTQQMACQMAHAFHRRTPTLADSQI